MSEKSLLTAFCRNCQAPRYRSIRPLGREDKIMPEYFKALDPEGTPPSPDTPIACYLCQSSLVLMADNKLPPMPKAEPVRNPSPVDPNPETFQKHDDSLPVIPPPLQVSTPKELTPRTESSVETLFELRPTEEMKFFNDTAESILIVTSQRIIRIKKGD